MAREKYQTLTEQMFYVLIALQIECCGVDIMRSVSQMTNERVSIGPGTLYALLDNFVRENIIRETAVVSRKKSYIITDIGREMLEREYLRLHTLISDFEKYKREENGDENC